jgi:5'-3' exoribonuclease 2
MGVPRFFPWLTKKFPQAIEGIKKQNLIGPVDNLCIDMNGLYHPVAQKVYRYGEKYKPKYRERIIPWHKNTKKCYGKIWTDILSLALLSQVKKRLVLCVDGVAPHSKIVQQRQRRFKNPPAKREEFNSNNITPGSMWMHNLSNFIEHKIREELTDPLSFLHRVEIVFSDEKVPGEGEHKIMSFIRNNTPDESYYVVGLDADLIMLSLTTHVPKIYILRDALYDTTIDYHLVNINTVRLGLINELSPIGLSAVEYPVGSRGYQKDNLFIDDFVFFCFLIGNDFIPHSPSLEIMEDGIDLLMHTYATIVKTNGYITRKRKGELTIHKNNLAILLQAVSGTEKSLLENKLKSGKYMKDDLLEKYTMRFMDESVENIEVSVDFENYRAAYYEHHFPGKSIQTVVYEYLKGLNWIIKYYTQNESSWKWKYPYYYSPFASDVGKYLKGYRQIDIVKDNPISMYKQLMCVLPKSSKDILPREMAEAFEEKELSEFYPDNFEIDLAGKFRDWEAIILLPFINLDKFIVVEKYITNLPKNAAKRGRFGRVKIFHYTKSKSYDFRSYYGVIVNCHVSMRNNF